MKIRRILPITLAAAVLGLPSTAHAQSSATDYPWSVDFGIGFDNGISGNINSSAIGTLQRPDDRHPHGTRTRCLTARACTSGSGPATCTVRTSRVPHAPHHPVTRRRSRPDGRPRRNRTSTGQDDDDQSMSLDFGGSGSTSTADRDDSRLRRGDSSASRSWTRPNVVLVRRRPVSFRTATDFYDRTAAFSFAFNVGAMYDATPRKRGCVRPDRPPRVRHRDDRSRRPGRHGSRDDQRQERALVAADPRRRPGPVLTSRGRHSGPIGSRADAAEEKGPRIVVLRPFVADVSSAATNPTTHLQKSAIGAIGCFLPVSRDSAGCAHHHSDDPRG